MRQHVSESGEVSSLSAVVYGTQAGVCVFHAHLTFFPLRDMLVQTARKKLHMAIIESGDRLGILGGTVYL